MSPPHKQCLYTQSSAGCSTAYRRKQAPCCLLSLIGKPSAFACVCTHPLSARPAGPPASPDMSQSPSLCITVSSSWPWNLTRLCTPSPPPALEAAAPPASWRSCTQAMRINTLFRLRGILLHRPQGRGEGEETVGRRQPTVYLPWRNTVELLSLLADSCAVKQFPYRDGKHELPTGIIESWRMGGELWGLLFLPAFFSLGWVDPA